VKKGPRASNGALHEMGMRSVITGARSVKPSDNRRVGSGVQFHGLLRPREAMDSQPAAIPNRRHARQCEVFADAIPLLFVSGRISKVLSSSRAGETYVVNAR
jgi:hypothetical protein